MKIMKEIIQKRKKRVELQCIDIKQCNYLLQKFKNQDTIPKDMISDSLQLSKRTISNYFNKFNIDNLYPREMDGKQRVYPKQFLQYLKELSKQRANTTFKKRESKLQKSAVKQNIKSHTIKEMAKYFKKTIKAVQKAFDEFYHNLTDKRAQMSIHLDLNSPIYYYQYFFEYLTNRFGQQVKKKKKKKKERKYQCKTQSIKIDSYRQGVIDYISKRTWNHYITLRTRKKLSVDFYRQIMEHFSCLVSTEDKNCIAYFIEPNCLHKNEGYHVHLSVKSNLTTTYLLKLLRVSIRNIIGGTRCNIKAECFDMNMVLNFAIYVTKHIYAGNSETYFDILSNKTL